MDSKELAELGYDGPPTREQEPPIDPEVMELYNELITKAREALQSKPESLQKNDKKVKVIRELVRYVHSRANYICDWEEELKKRAEGLNKEEEELQKKAEELNNKEEEVKKKDVYKRDENLWTEMLDMCRMNQESLQKLKKQVDSLDEEFGKIASSSQSNAAARMEIMEMPRTTTALIPQPATHSHSVVEHGDHQGNRAVSSGAAMRPIVPAPLPAYHSTQTVFIPCELRIQVVPLGAEPLVPAAYDSTGLTTPGWVASSSDATPHPQAQMPQPESGNGCGTSSSTGDRGKVKQHS